MDIVSSFLTGFGDAFQPTVLLAILIGSVIATILGVIPVLAGGLAIVLIMPYLYGMNPLIAMPLLLALDAVSCTGGSMTSILLNIPGTLINAATCIDGYPMAQKGQGARAVGAALTASAVGGVLTVPLALVMIPVLVPFILLFKSPEMFLLIILGLLFLSVLTTKGNIIKGLISAVLGLTLSMVGAQAETGVSRFTFGIGHLYEGVPLVIVVLGMYAVPALVELYTKRTSPIAKFGDVASLKKKGALFEGFKDVMHHKWLTFKCMVLGYLVGVVPGIGAFTSTFITYGLAKKGSKHPEEFGHGAVEGVIAPEAANNAKEAGGLLTTMAFGIPGTGSMAIIMAALVIMGIQPGPTMLTEHTALSITMLISLVIANLFAVIMMWIGAPFMVKVTQIKPAYLFAIIIPLVFLGAFSNYEMIFDLFLAVFVGLVGTCMVRFGYSAPSFILGFVLGHNLEYYFWKSLDGYGGTFVFASGISTALLVICIILLFNRPLGKLLKRTIKKIKNNGSEETI